jgi:peptidoglycan hydrolase-like protein with peptidoglycan-binding domain
LLRFVRPNEEGTVSKSGLIITVSVAIASGCALSLSPEPEVETAEPYAHAVEFQSEAAPQADRAQARPAVPPTVAPTRVLTQDDIRRMQLRMREVGFDPGPINGVAGEKTKAALRRFDSGCAQVQGLLEPNQHAAGTIEDKRPTRVQTFAIQRQLQAAGFNPGPVDGIFGTRTQTVLTHVQNGCPTMADFATLIDLPVAVAGNEVAPTSVRNNAMPGSAAQTRVAQAEQRTIPIVARPQEEIRILQLRLRDAGFDPGPFDGIMGPKTKLALQQYQARHRGRKGASAVTADFKGHY